MEGRRQNKTRVPNVLFSMLIFMLTLTGCLNLSIPNKIIRTSTNDVIKKANNLFPIESFTMIQQEFIMKIRDCDSEQNCESVVVGTANATGSGFIVKTDENFSYVMTAGHVCSPPPPAPGLDLSMLEVGYRITLKTGYGRQALSEIIAIDTENDLCLLKASDRIGPALEISDKEIMLHEEVYNMASPAGLASSLAVPVFEGYYVGNVTTLSIFSIPAVPGSSGSPIMTKDNKVVSLVSAAAVRFDEYAIGPQTRAIREFLLAHLPE
ncbi:MAG: hypothetical protein CMF51_04365 [Legionellales bacterium]|nr:hypothetical protein [Legionellales bacterium]